MAKDNKGKNLGKGIGQRKDGLYCARYEDSSGKRVEKCFKTTMDKYVHASNEYLVSAVNCFQGTTPVQKGE